MTEQALAHQSCTSAVAAAAPVWDAGGGPDCKFQGTHMAC